MAIVDFGDLQAGLTEGSYVGIVKGLNYQTDERKDIMLVSFTASINGRDHRTKLYSMDGKGKFFLYQALLSIGVNVPKGRVDLDTLPLEGKKVEFKVSEREYNGKKFRDLEPVKYLGEATDEEKLILQAGAPF